MDLTLYAVSSTGRVAFGDLLKGTKYVQVEKNAADQLVLTAVTIKAASGQAADATQNDEPWEEDEQPQA